jgi:hypothetical protein
MDRADLLTHTDDDPHHFSTLVDNDMTQHGMACIEAKLQSERAFLVWTVIARR